MKNVCYNQCINLEGERVMKKSKKVLTILSIVLVVIFGVVLFYYFGAAYPEYNKIAKSEFDIVGLNDGFVPQGIAYDNQSNNFFLSGYMTDEKLPSRIYFAGSGEKAGSYVTLKVGGEDYFGHAGGIAVYGTHMYVAGDGLVHEINLVDVLDANSGDAVDVTYTLEAENGADCLTVYNGQLWVGEFYKKGKYETDESHHIELESGEVNMAVSFAYELDGSGIVSDVPTCGLSTPAQVQGLEFFGDGNLMISTSYSLPDSKLYIFDGVMNQTPTNTIDVGGKTVPLYVISESMATKTINAPCMSEEIVLANDSIYILYESACNKYKFFTRTRTRNVHSIQIEQLASAR